MTQTPARFWFARLRLLVTLSLSLCAAIAALLCMAEPNRLSVAHAAAPALPPPCTPVTNTNDDGPGSLRAAVACAAAGTVITFDPGLAGQTILLTGVSQIFIATADLSIDGSDAPGLIVDGNNTHRVLATTSDLSLVALTIQHGNPASGGGGGIVSSNPLTLSNVTFLSNTSQTEGGGAYSANMLKVNGGLFRNNRSGSYGGALAAIGPLGISGTQFITNESVAAGGGAFAYGGARVIGGLFQDNASTTSSGGGLGVQGGASVLTGRAF